MADTRHAAPRARIMMCAPDYFEVSYSINPWMHPDDWNSRRDELTGRSADGWSLLRHKLEQLGAAIELVPPADGLPDMVFTANAAVILDGKALNATFRFPERQGETPLFRKAFDQLAARGILTEVHDMPAGVHLEGAGDCVHDINRETFFLGYGFRSDREAAPVVAELFGEQVVPLELVDPRFYHMDTCLNPLSRGHVMWVPCAFSRQGQGLIREIVGDENLIEVPMEDAEKLACNAVNLGDDIVLAEASQRMRSMVAEHGYTTHEVPIRSFGMSGGSAWCLVLRLDRHSKRGARAAQLELAEAGD
ncbi:dimethylarginine dimethylaminohydrolase family protein [Indioceanicola profundi]|uniref:dimethylarginine dimethylaminohydrolase family protein n=1 Tax=Indioceanicola profundi TaxID=2220096 RepID=UPI000E6AB8C2|nr:arginine deiminase-related protein [Indioceanicola profundi]